MPTRTTVDVKLDIPKYLTKDLQDDEAICQTCGGLGLVVRPNEYGLREENKKAWRVSFPYRNESLFPCPSCYNGVVKLCMHCGTVLPRGHLICCCETVQSEKRVADLAKQLERWQKAQKISFTDAITRFKMVYVEPADEYFITEELLDRLSEYWELGEPLIERIYGTTTASITIDAASIIEGACEELAEAAADNIDSDDERELQDLLDSWAEKHKKDTTTYFPDYEVGVILPEGATR